MAGLKFSIDTKELSEFLDFAPKKTSIALLRAVKRGGNFARTLAARTVAKDTGLKAGVVKEAMRFVRPNAKTITAEIKLSLRRIPLIHFGAKGLVPSRGKGGGVSYKVGAGRKRIKSAFIAEMPTGHVGVFTRKGSTRLPIQQKFGPSLGRVLDIHRSRITEAAGDVTEKELARLLNRAFGTKK